MSEEYKKIIAKLPSVSFISDLTLPEMRDTLVSDFCTAYKNITGDSKTLAAADPIRLILNAVSLQLYQLAQYIDRSGKQDLLKYSYGEYLDNLALLKGVTRKTPTAANTTVRFTLSATRASATPVPAGTRVTGNNGLYFATNSYAEIAIGETSVDVPCSCQISGTVGNGIAASGLNVLVDPLPYIASVANLTETASGTDIESDSDLSERVYYAPSAYSVAGPSDAYKYHAKAFSSDIADVKVVSPSAGTVSVYFMLDGGELPTSTLADDLTAYLSGDSIRPMTDSVTAYVPTSVSYNITLTYYIDSQDSGSAVAIQTAVTNAVAAYKTWQSVIGRDINPSELIHRIVAAGAKRAVVTAPVYTTVPETSVAIAGTTTVTYGGLET